MLWKFKWISKPTDYFECFVTCNCRQNNVFKSPRELQSFEILRILTFQAFLLKPINLRRPPTRYKQPNIKQKLHSLQSWRCCSCYFAVFVGHDSRWPLREEQFGWKSSSKNSAKRPHEKKNLPESALMGKHSLPVVELFIYVFFSSPHIISHSIMLLFCFPSNASRTHFSLNRSVAQLAIA